MHICEPLQLSSIVSTENKSDSETARIKALSEKLCACVRKDKPKSINQRVWLFSSIPPALVFESLSRDALIYMKTR